MQAGYFRTAWADIKNSPGWFGKLCLLALILFIPVFGPIVLYGYAFGWARDMAWDVHRPMPARIFGNEDGKLYSRGFFAWLILLVAGLVVYWNWTHGNRRLIDNKNHFDRAIISLPNGEVVDGKISSWLDYTNSDVVQITIGGKTYLTHYANVVMIDE